MKKWVILVLVLLGCLLLAMQYLMNKKAKGQVSPATTSQGEPGGVPLPPSATGYVIPDSSFAPAPENLNDPSRLRLPIVPTNYKGACPGGSLAEMSATHGKFWGRLAKETPFSPNNTRRMYGFVADYIGCVAVARKNALICDMLPPEPPEKGSVRPGAGRPVAAGGRSQPRPPEKGAIKERAQDGLRYNCRERVNPTLFIAYMAGKSRSSDSCQAMLAGWEPLVLANISVTDFCAATAKGIDAVNNYMQKTLGKKKPKRKKGIVEKDVSARQRFATSESSCGGNAECINGAKLYNAIKSGNVSRCPRVLERRKPAGADDKEPAPKRPANASSSDVLCEAAITGAAVSCEPIVKAMSEFYCAAVERTKKKTGGFIGMSKGEIETAIAQKKLQAAEKELRKKELEKIQIEINKKVRKTLGKDTK
ncbi:MAG: hypothetical protein KKH28_01850 [Elusimicrobia bacterium]|nr:hypothetical protein [Elusimicrobiota bacterium]